MAHICMESFVWIIILLVFSSASRQMIDSNSVDGTRLQFTKVTMNYSRKSVYQITKFECGRSIIPDSDITDQLETIPACNTNWPSSILTARHWLMTFEKSQNSEMASIAKFTRNFIYQFFKIVTISPPAATNKMK